MRLTPGECGRLTDCMMGQKSRQLVLWRQPTKSTFLSYHNCPLVYAICLQRIICHSASRHLTNSHTYKWPRAYSNREARTKIDPRSYLNRMGQVYPILTSTLAYY